MSKIGLQNFSVHLNHPSPLDLQKPGPEINRGFRQKHHQNEQKMPLHYYPPSITAVSIKMKCEMNENADCGIAFTADLPTLQHTSHYSKFAALTITTNHTHFC